MSEDTWLAMHDAENRLIHAQAVYERAYKKWKATRRRWCVPGDGGPYLAGPDYQTFVMYLTWRGR